MIYHVLASYLLVDVAPLTSTLMNKFKCDANSKSPAKDPEGIALTASLDRVNPHSPFAKIPTPKHSYSPFANVAKEQTSRGNSPAPTFGGMK